MSKNIVTGIYTLFERGDANAMGIEIDDRTGTEKQNIPRYCPRALKTDIILSLIYGANIDCASESADQSRNYF